MFKGALTHGSSGFVGTNCRISEAPKIYLVSSASQKQFDLIPLAQCDVNWSLEIYALGVNKINCFVEAIDVRPDSSI